MCSNCSESGPRADISLHKTFNNKVNFSIQDEGIGIPKEELLSIFDVFVVSSKTHTPAGGKGVGLALCKKTIELHKGKIWAESVEGKGSVFRFLIPNFGARKSEQ